MFTTLKQAVAALAVVAIPIAASATSMVKLTTEDMAHIADAIVVGEVTEVTFEAKGARTRNVIRVLETWKGDIAVDSRIDVYEPGGREGSVIADVPGTAGYLKNERVVLFLNARTRGGYLPIGYFQGKYTVIEKEHGKSLVTRIMVPVRKRGSALDLKSVSNEQIRLDSKNDFDVFAMTVKGIVEADRKAGIVGKDLPQYRGIGR